MGVGSTGVAAVDTDRKFLGFEIEDSYFEVAKKRLKHLQPNLFAVSEKSSCYKVHKPRKTRS
jgi:DNA modification methylase